MPRIWLPLLAALSLAAAAPAATRPRYGGTLRVEVRESAESADPPQSGFGLAELNSSFRIVRWEPGARAGYSSAENAPGGRPYVDGVDVVLARPLREQSIDLEIGKADVVELGPNELRRATAGRRVWTSSPVRVLALTFGARVADVRVREALSLAVDRAAIHNVLLQRVGEVSGALLPQWVSGYAFLFPAVPDLNRARALIAGLPPAARTLSMSVDDPMWQQVAARIVVNARDAGIALSLGPSPAADVRLTEARVVSADPGRALAAIAASLGLGEPSRGDSAESLYRAERALLDGFRAIPLFHLPYVYGVGPRVKGGPGIGPLGEWRFETVWLEGGRP